MPKIPIDEYVQLCRAGYTPDEINQYIQSLNSPQQQPVQQPAPQQEQQPAQQPEQQPVQQPAQQPQENETTLMLKQILGAIQTSNINNISLDRQPTAPDAVQIMGSILSPVPPQTK